MSNKPAYHTYLNNETPDLTELSTLLKQDYAELMRTSVVLRKESRQLSEDSRLLRRVGTRLISDLGHAETSDHLLIEQPHKRP